VAGVAVVAFGSLDDALAALRGESLWVEPAYVDFGAGVPDDVLTAAVTITNRSASPVRLIGGTSDCSCFTTKDLPVTIPPSERVQVEILLKVPSSSKGGLMNRHVEFLTDSPDHPRVRLRVGCLVKP
jgi:hypothetical protein